jgi:hypothetical protein
MLDSLAMTHRTRTLKRLSSLAAALGLAACGGGEVGGTVTGLGPELSVTLLNNGGDSLIVSRNGNFFFADRLDANAAYAVTVQSQPVGQSCAVANGSGSLDAEGSTVDTVRVSCSFTSGLRGTVSGLLTGVAIVLANGNARQTLAANGPFAFAETLADGTRYSVSVLTQPSNQTCSLQNEAGTFFARSFLDIIVTCN